MKLVIMLVFFITSEFHFISGSELNYQIIEIHLDGIKKNASHQTVSIWKEKTEAIVNQAIRPSTPTSGPAPPPISSKAAGSFFHTLSENESVRSSPPPPRSPQHYGSP